MGSLGKLLNARAARNPDNPGSSHGSYGPSNFKNKSHGEARRRRKKMVKTAVRTPLNS